MRKLAQTILSIWCALPLRVGAVFLKEAADMIDPKWKERRKVKPFFSYSSHKNYSLH